MSLFGVDWDSLFAYDTVKVVRVYDRRAGIIYKFWQVVIGVYVFFFVGVISKKYLQEEKVQGRCIVEVNKLQYSDQGIPWDIYDRVVMPSEQGAIFIPTRVLITRGQTQDDQFCEAPRVPCNTNEDCNVQNENVQKAECVNKHCLRRQWCPAEDEEAGVTETHYLEFDQVQLRFSSHTQFPRFQMYMTTSDEKESTVYPEENANTYLLKDLLGWAGVNAGNIMQYGALMYVNLILDSPVHIGETYVKQKIESHSIDVETGYNFIHNEYYYDGDTRKRDTYHMYGIRVLAFTVGFAERIFPSGIVLQFSSAMALIAIAEFLTDQYLVKWVAERAHYRSKRTIETEDFNDDDEEG